MIAERVRWFLLAVGLAACGGGAKNVAVAPEPAPAAADAGSDEATSDAGVAQADDDAGAAQAVTSLPPLPPSAPADAGAPPAKPTGGEDGARALLAQFVAPTADHAALTKSLRPTTPDYRALFDARTAAKIEAAQAKDWDSNKAVIKPKPSQTEVKVWAATGAELAHGDGNAKEFPGDYKKLAKHLVPTATYFRFKFVEPGKETGTAYDGLAFVNGHWVIVPKPWRALEAKHASSDDDEPEKPVKKKPKKKK